MAHARNLFPYRRVNCGETSVALRPGVHLGNFQPVGIVHPLRVDFSTADHGNFSGQTPQRVASRNRAGVQRAMWSPRLRARENLRRA